MSEGFVHLHTHSEFSLLDGASRLSELASTAAALDMGALALTDHGVMYGVVPFVQECKKVSIKPIVGCEIYVTQGSRFDRGARSDQKLNHLLLLAENETGYRNLMKIVTRSFLDGFYYKPRSDRDLIANHSEGLIALTACLTGEIPRRLMDDDYDGARRIAGEYLDIFGPDRFFLEVQNQGIPEQTKVNEGMARLSSDLTIPLVATNDVHYTHAEDHTAQDVLLCIQTGSTIDQVGRMKFSSDQFYLKSRDEMARALPGFEHALARSVEIAERCNVGFDFETLHLPDYDVPAGRTLDEHLEGLVWEGIVRRYGPNAAQDAAIAKRVGDELAVIEGKGFSGYFLIVADFIDYARNNGIMVGPGRGSAAGSIVSYSLGITQLDPLAHGLLFERFLNPERMSMPDIDIDFDDEKRDRVIAYVREKYGEDRVAQIITFSKMKAKAAVRDAARVLDHPFSVGDRIAKQIPDEVDITITEALRKNPELREQYETDEIARQVLDAARSVEGLSRQDSIHAAGVVISREPLTEYVPLQQKNEAEIVTQYPMNAIADLGLLKMDFLGLRTLTVLAQTVHLVDETRGLTIDLEAIPFDDDATFDLYRQADTMGVFQVESRGMRALLVNLQPEKFSEIVALIALFRPGPLGSGMADDFVARKHGRKKITYLHPMLEDVLSETYGTIVYQEQVMQIAQLMAGYTPGEADDLRKAMGKKIADKMASQKEKFVKGSVANGVPEKRAAEIFDLIEFFAGYGFNKSHSAAYAVVSYQTAYLKAHYRPEFMAALLTSIMGDKDKVLAYVNDCREADIEVLGPDVNESDHHFTVVEGRIRFSLTAIRNVGEGLVETIVAERQGGGKYTSIFDFCSRVDAGQLNKRALESLIKAGAFDSIGHTRKHNLAVFEQAADSGARRQRDLDAGQASIFDLGAEHGLDLEVPEPDPDTTELDREDLLAFEKEMLGVYVSDHPLKGLEEAIRRATDYSTADFKEQRDQTMGWIAGIATDVKKKPTKRGDLMLTMRIEDLEGSVDVTVFPRTYQECGAMCTEDALLRVKARLDIRDEGNPQALAQEIEELSTDATVYPARGPLRIFVDEHRVEDETLERLKRTLTRFVGEADVFVHVTHGDGIDVFRLGPAYRVDPTRELVGEIEQLIGESTCTLG